jgi:hypothetical protein
MCRSTCPDLDRVVTGTARLLKTGGLYLSGTINRTRTSKLPAITVTRPRPMTRLTDAAIHDGDMFIEPAELAGVLERDGLRPSEMAGLGPRAKLPVAPGSHITAPVANHLPGNSAAGWTPAPGPASARHIREAPSRQRLRGALRAAARLRPAPGT